LNLILLLFLILHAESRPEMEEQVLGQIFGDHANRDGECDSKKASICWTLMSMAFLFIMF